MKLIDKDALVAEIKNLENTYKKCPTRNSYEEGLKDGILIGYEDALHKIDTFEAKEVEEMYERPTIKIKDDTSVISRLQYIDDDLKQIAEFILEYASWNLHKDEWNHPVLEVPLFRVLDALIQRGKPYCEC